MKRYLPVLLALLGAAALYASHRAARHAMYTQFSAIKAEDLLPDYEGDPDVHFGVNPIAVSKEPAAKKQLKHADELYWAARQLRYGAYMLFALAIITMLWRHLCTTAESCSSQESSAPPTASPTEPSSTPGLPPSSPPSSSPPN